MHLRFFISSPGDVADERTFARQVIEQELPKDPFLRDKNVICDAVSWDDPAAPVPMVATLTPQEAINRGLVKPSECDVVIVILWSRMGTRLPEDYRKPDGTPYLSGTEYEFEDAMQATPRPHVLVYRRETPVAFHPGDPDNDEKSQQLSSVERFFARFIDAEGSLSGAYARYDTPQDFRDRLRSDLKEFINHLLAAEGPKASASHLAAPPPYALIARELEAGNVVPVIGADAGGTGPVTTKWDPTTPKFLPSGAELSRFLADACEFPSEDDREVLSEVASYYEISKSRGSLHERLREVFDAPALQDAAVPPFFTLLAEIEAPLLIVSTNFDTTLERAFHAASKPYDLVAYPTERKDLANAVLWWKHGARSPETPTPNKLDIDLKSTSVIFKMYGSVIHESEEWDGFVITEMDYIRFLSRIQSAIPGIFSTHLQEHSLLFVGFSLRDWASRGVLKGLSRYFTRRVFREEADEAQSWAIQASLSELEIDFWRNWGVYPFEVGLDTFVKSLRVKFKE